MNKKSMVIEDIFRLIFTVIVFFSIVFMAKAFIKTQISTTTVEMKLLLNRLILSKELNYIDSSSGRVHTGIIDLEKFTSDKFENNILSSIFYGNVNSEASAKLTLKDLESGKIYESYYNKGLYNEKRVLVRAKLTGTGSAQGASSKIYVTIKDKGELKNGVLDVDVILPNS